MRQALVKTATLLFLIVELICLLMGLSAEQVLLRSVPVYVLVLVIGHVLIGILEKVPQDENPGKKETQSIDIQVGSDPVPSPDQAQAVVDQLSGQDSGPDLGESIKKTAQEKPHEMARAISSVMKNE